MQIQCLQLLILLPHCMLGGCCNVGDVTLWKEKLSVASKCHCWLENERKQGYSYPIFSNTRVSLKVFPFMVQAGALQQSCSSQCCRAWSCLYMPSASFSKGGCSIARHLHQEFFLFSFMSNTEYVTEFHSRDGELKYKKLWDQNSVL